MATFNLTKGISQTLEYVRGSFHLRRDLVDTPKRANEVVIPILAQRLLINMRKVDYVGSQPVASILLFASQGHAPESDLDGETGSFEMSAAPTSSRGKRVENTTTPEKCGVGEGGSNV